MQTISFLLFRLQESGLESQDILSEKPWKLKKKICWHHFCIRGKKQHMFFLCLIIRFRHFFPLPLDTHRIRVRMKIFARIRIRNPGK